MRDDTRFFTGPGDRSTIQALPATDRLFDDPAEVSALEDGDVLRRKWRFDPTAIGVHLLAFGIVIGFWYLMHALLAEQRKFILPTPHLVIRDGFFGGDFHDIFDAMVTTGKVAIFGLLISIALGFAFAIMMSQGRNLERAMFPYFVVIQTIPILALVPLIGVWQGRALKARVIACVLIAIFPIIANTLLGLKSAERTQHELFTLHGASRWTRLFKLQFPAALPAIFTGLRIAAGGCVIGAIVGDFFFVRGDTGIGRYINNAYKDTKIPELFTATICSSAFGIIIFLGFGWLASRVTRNWHDSSPHTG